MSEYLTDEQLREWRGSLDTSGKPIAADDAISLIDETLALRARVAQMEAALEPFARNVHAQALRDALGPITREHLLAANSALGDAPQ